MQRPLDSPTMLAKFCGIVDGKAGGPGALLGNAMDGGRKIPFGLGLVAKLGVVWNRYA